MKYKANIFRKTTVLLLGVFTVSLILSCVGDELFRDDLPDSNTKVDTILPEANFSFSVDENDFTLIHFQDLSSESNTYMWNFGTGDTSTERDPSYQFTGGEGTYSVTLTTGDSNGASSSLTLDVVIEEPEEPEVPDPAIVNGEFVKLPKSSGSDCACSGWINRDLGEQGESSTANGLDVVKFDNNEPDHVYQEFEVVPNAEYIVETSIRHSSTDGSMPSSLEIRVLAGTGYEAGYTPVYYTDTAVMPQGNSSTGFWGYRSIAQVENSDNNLFLSVVDNPGNDDYNTFTFSFNAGANNSVALFMRGVGGDASGDYGYNSGNEEIRSAYVTITAIND